MNKMSRQEQKVQTRAGLIAEAERLFILRGISATTTSEIAKALKVSHGTLFVHFPTRESLLKSVVEEFGERLSEALGSRCTSDLSLNALLHAHLEVLSEYEGFYMRLISESQSLAPHIRSVLYSMNASLSYRFFRAAKNGTQEKIIKKMPQALFFNTWMGLVHYYILNRDLLSDRLPILQEVGDDLVLHFLKLIES